MSNADPTPGRDLDERVARAVWTPDELLQPPRCDWWWWRDGPASLWTGPAFSLDRESAMTLLDALAGRGWEWTIDYTPIRLDRRPYAVCLEHLELDGAGYAAAMTLPLAVCAAVLVALEPEEGGDE